MLQFADCVAHNPCALTEHTMIYRQKDLESFLEQTRQKFVGFKVTQDLDSLAGLPKPIHEGVKVLKDHLYVSLAEHQVKREEEITKNPLSMVRAEMSMGVERLSEHSMNYRKSHSIYLHNDLGNIHKCDLYDKLLTRVWG